MLQVMSEHTQTVNYEYYENANRVLSFLLAFDYERKEILVECFEYLNLHTVFAESRSSKTWKDSIPSLLDFLHLVQVPPMLLQTEQQKNTCHIRTV
jgi:hypothetical protein